MVIIPWGESWVFALLNSAIFLDGELIRRLHAVSYEFQLSSKVLNLEQELLSWVSWAVQLDDDSKETSKVPLDRQINLTLELRNRQEPATGFKARTKSTLL